MEMCLFYSCSHHDPVAQHLSPLVSSDRPSVRRCQLIAPCAPCPDGVRGVEQDSFRVTVTAADSDAVVWDSGRVYSDENRHVTYGAWGNKVRPCRFTNRRIE